LIHFDETEHLYTDGDCVIPSVTQILESVGFIDKRWYNDHACTRGTYVHKAVYLHHRMGGVKPESIDSEILPYFKAYLAFLESTRFEPAECEQLVYSKVFGFAGTLDLRGDLFGIDAIIDIKTGCIQPWAAIQTAGYNLASEKKAGIRYGLNLTNKGIWKLEKYKNGNDEKVFIAAATVHNRKLGRV